MTARKFRNSWQDLGMALLAVSTLIATQIVLVWLSFNFFGRAFKWPPITFWQAGALFMLCRALLNITVNNEKSK